MWLIVEWAKLFFVIWALVFVLSNISEVTYHRTPVAVVLTRDALLRQARNTFLITFVWLISTIVWHVMGWGPHPSTQIRALPGSDGGFPTPCALRYAIGEMIPQTAFVSDGQFSQHTFRRWLDERPREDINHYELVNGRIVMTPPSAWSHSRIAMRIGQRLSQHVEAQRLGIVLESSAGYDLPSGDTIAPDVSYVSSARWASVPRPARGAFLRMAPTIVVEVLSPSTAQRDRTEKKDIYARNGVDEYWIVDTEACTVTVFRLRRRRYTTGNVYSRGSVLSRALPQLAITIEEIFEL